MVSIYIKETKKKGGQYKKAQTKKAEHDSNLKFPVLDATQRIVLDYMENL